MKITSFRINGRTVSRLSINGREVSLGKAPALCDALCFTAQEPGSTVKLTKNKSSAPAVNLQTSTDGSSWTPYNVEDVITLANVDDKVYFKAVGSNNKMATDQYSYNKFKMTGKIAASGNVNSLLEEDETTARTMSLAGKDYCYSFMFDGCTSLTQAPELPATTLANTCYAQMFYNCTSLTQASELPSTTLAYGCYAQMFYNCTSLTQAPELPATTLADYCYQNMFQNCSSLTQAPELPATTLADFCYSQMFYNCTSLTKSPALPATILSGFCYYDMFYGCSSLTQAPELPATTLADNCYLEMFQKCTNLNYVKVGFTNWDTIDATSDWLPNNSGTFVCPQTLIDNTTDRTTSTVPANWSMVAA